MTIGVPVSARIRHAPARPLLTAGALAAGCAVLRVVDPVGGPTICPFKAWTGLDCPGCGATRAAHQLLNGHVVAALDLNAMFVLAVPFLAWWIGARLVNSLRGATGAVLHVPPVALRVAIVLLVLFGVVRNLPLQPFAWLGTGG